ncbi:MAG TPA: hypothetical protein VK348_10745 [Planctomycetota bacterium]|nr:hypothetical protein [Planctomycetota bacterium]
MKGIEKLTSVRLAEVLSQKGAVPSEAITNALYAQDRHGEPFVQVLVDGGHITEWDLAKLVTENFQLPFLMASNYQIADTSKARLPKLLLFEHMLVPLDVFDNVVVVVMPIMISFEVMAKIQKEHNCDLFPYVGLLSENKKVLTELFKDYPAWLEHEQKRREVQAVKKGSKDKSGNWMSIFDAGDQAIQDTLVKKPTKK